MKTIRTNTFETNSSSTHSVTIHRKGDTGGKIVRPLVVDGILYPDALKDYSLEVGEATTLVCDTKDKKAAIVCHWIEEEEDFSEVPRKAMLELIKSLCGYSDIVELEDSDYSPYSEYGDDVHVDFIDDLKSDELKSFEEFIRGIVLNDDMEINDIDSPC